MAIVLGAISVSVSAFVPTSSSVVLASRPSSTSSTRGPATYLQSSQDKDRIKKAGAGLTTIPPGDLCLYDPNENGKLQGSSSLMERVQRGASFGNGGGGTASADEIIGSSASTPSADDSNTKKITTNLTKVLGEMDSRMRGQGRSQY